MNHHQAQEKLAETILRRSANKERCYWKLLGDQPNCLCKFLGVEEEEVKSLLRLCGVLGPSGRISFNKFEFLVTRCETQLSVCLKDFYIMIGKGQKEAVIPEHQYDAEGNLCVFPVLDIHYSSGKTKSQKGNIPSLLEKATEAAADNNKEAAKPKEGKLPAKSPKELLMEFIKELVGSPMAASSVRKLNRLFKATISEEAKILLQESLEELDAIAQAAELKARKEEEEVAPDRAVSLVAAPPIVSPVEGTSLEKEISAEAVVTTPQQEFLEELKEETSLQTLLHKRMHEKKERVVSLEHRNGKPLMVVIPPDSKTSATFVDSATRTKWVDDMLDTPEKIEGMATHLVKTQPSVVRSVAQKNKMKTGLALTTAQTIALGRIGNLNDGRLKKVKSYLRNVGKIAIKHDIKECQAINEQVGLLRANENVVFGNHLYEWNKIKGKEKKAPEQTHYWNSSLANEVEADIDLFIAEGFLENPKRSSIPRIHYKEKGFDVEGVTTLIGGDHGDKNCPIVCKLNLTSPAIRKEMGVLNHHCPIVQIASIKCTKDTYDLLDKTIMPTIKRQIIQLKASGIVTVHYKNDAKKKFRSFMLPKSINEATLHVAPNKHLTYAYGSSDSPTYGSIDLNPYFGDDFNWFELAAIVSVKQFNELFIGDLAFQAMSIGMNNSAGDCCVLCQSIASQFNTSVDERQPDRTNESQEEALVRCLADYREAKEKGLATMPKNHNGVNCQGLLEIDPQRIIVPVLHCPMGLVDKLWETFKLWVNLCVEKFEDENQNTIRNSYRLAHEKERAREKERTAAKKVKLAKPTNKEAKKAFALAKKEHIKAKNESAKLRQPFNELMSKHNVKTNSLVQRFEVVFRANGVKREHYHGGEFNGVNCIRIMEQSQDIWRGFLAECRKSRCATVTEEELETTINKHINLLGTLDIIWSSVRGLECGLLPTDEQIAHLEKAIRSGKRQWIDLGIGTMQPKWHLTFDGHLLEQVKRHGGLADKSDESVEKFHQELKVLRTRFRGITSYEVHERCIRRELRRQRSPVITKEVERCQELIKDKSPKRKADNKRKQEEKRQAKKARREAVVL